MDDKILKFWEPKAPNYQERKDCLVYAFQEGFRTSVSMEPMLDTANIDSLIKDLEPFVTENIWVGMMNHLGRITKNADKRLLDEIELINLARHRKNLPLSTASIRTIRKSSGNQKR